jgi:hypothetical protein
MRHSLLAVLFQSLLDETFAARNDTSNPCDKAFVDRDVTLTALYEAFLTCGFVSVTFV